MNNSVNPDAVNQVYIPETFDSPYGWSFSKDVGIFSVHLSKEDKTYKLKVRLGFKALSHEWEAKLDLLNPSVTLNFSDSKLLGASITLGIIDATGRFFAKAKWSTLFWSDSAEVNLSILAPFQFGLEAVGVVTEGIKKYANEIAKFKVNHQVVTGFNNAINDEASRVGVNPEDVFNLMKDQPEMAKAILSNFTNASQTELEEIGSLSVEDFELGLAAVVHDERIQHLYPGIDKKFEFREEILNQIKEYPSAKVEDFSQISGDDIAEYIKEILIGLIAWLGMSVAALGIVVTVITALIGAASLTGPGAVVVVLILGVLFYTVGPLCLLIWAATTVATVAYLIIDGFVRFTSIDESNQNNKLESSGILSS